MIARLYLRLVRMKASPPKCDRTAAWLKSGRRFEEDELHLSARFYPSRKTRIERKLQGATTAVS